MISTRFRVWLFYGVALAVVLVDQWSKSWVRAHLQPGVPWDPLPWLRPVLSLTFVRNTGVVFGLLPGLGWLFAAVHVVAIILILYFYHNMPERTWLTSLTMGMLMGGAGGNLIDRLSRGWVTDFFDFNFWPMQDWAVFNVADSAVVVSTCILMVYVLSQVGPERDDSRPGLA